MKISWARGLGGTLGGVAALTVGVPAGLSLALPLQDLLGLISPLDSPVSGPSLASASPVEDPRIWASCSASAPDRLPEELKLKSFSSLAALMLRLRLSGSSRLAAVLSGVVLVRTR